MFTICCYTFYDILVYVYCTIFYYIFTRCFGRTIETLQKRCTNIESKKNMMYHDVPSMPIMVLGANDVGLQPAKVCRMAQHVRREHPDPGYYIADLLIEGVPCGELKPFLQGLQAVGCAGNVIYCTLIEDVGEVACETAALTRVHALLGPVVLAFLHASSYFHCRRMQWHCRRQAPHRHSIG